MYHFCLTHFSLTHVPITLDKSSDVWTACDRWSTTWLFFYLYSSIFAKIFHWFISASSVQLSKLNYYCFFLTKNLVATKIMKIKNWDILKMNNWNMILFCPPLPLMPYHFLHCQMTRGNAHLKSNGSRLCNFLMWPGDSTSFCPLWLLRL